MFCVHCGAALNGGDRFCTKCGCPNPSASASIGSEEKILPIAEETKIEGQQSLGEKWWHRLLKVLYIVAYIPLVFVLLIVWEVNKTSYGEAGYTDTGTEAFFYCLLALAIYVAILRLVKIGVVYVAFGQKPNWKKEFNKFF